MNNNNELEDIRKQINELKQRLDRESTLNEQLLHDSLKTKIRSVHTLVGKVITMGIIGIALWIIIGIAWHLSTYFIVFTCAMMLVSVITEYLINRMKYDSITTNLKDTVTRLMRMKKLRLRQTITGCSVLFLVWMPWLAYEFSQHFDAPQFLPMIIGAAVGHVFGACIGIGILLKIQRANDEMIRQIKEFTE